MDITEETYTSSKRNQKVALIGDIHIASLTWLKEFTEWAFKFIQKQRLLWIGMGDYMEYATKNSVGIGVYEQTMSPDMQKYTFKKYSKPVRKKNIGLHDGNHDKRGKDTGMTELVNICESLDVPYLNSHVLHTFQVGDYEFKLLTTHGRSGAKLPHTKINSLKRLQDAYDSANVLAMGHVHRLEHKPEYRNYIDVFDGHQRVVHDHDKSLILTGHFMDYVGSYAQEMGLYPEPAGFPILTFRNDGSFDVELIYAPSVVQRNLGKAIT